MTFSKGKTDSSCIKYFPHCIRNMFDFFLEFFTNFLNIGKRRLFLSQEEMLYLRNKKHQYRKCITCEYVKKSRSYTYIFCELTICECKTGNFASNSITLLGYSAQCAHCSFERCNGVVNFSLKH
jgi:hypothetical protein